MESDESELWIADTPSCAEFPISVPARGRVQGVVLDEDGSLLKDAFVYLLSADDGIDSVLRDGLGLTLEEGKYFLDDLPPGRYTLSMNRRSGADRHAPFLESETPVFVVEEGRTVTAPALRVIRTTPVKVVVTVRDAAGAPLSGLEVDHFQQMNNGERGHLRPPKTDARGQYEIELWKGQRYGISIGPENDPWVRVEFVADGQSLTITARPH